MVISWESAHLFMSLKFCVLLTLRVREITPVPDVSSLVECRESPWLPSLCAMLSQSSRGGQRQVDDVRRGRLGLDPGRGLERRLRRALVLVLQVARPLHHGLAVALVHLPGGVLRVRGMNPRVCVKSTELVTTLIAVRGRSGSTKT